MDLAKSLVGLPCDPVDRTRAVSVVARTSDLFDAFQRLLGDAQRFDYRLLSAAGDQSDQDTAIIRLELEVGSDQDLSMIGARFARHPTIETVDVEAAGQQRVAR